MEYGLIGEHLGHSFSKTVHELLADYQYEIHEVSFDDFDSFMREKKFKAINVTIPYKEMVIPYLNELDDSAKNVGAINTIVNRDGYLIGYNTDMLGFIDLVKMSGLELKDKNVIILGTGGASKACFAACKKLLAKSIHFVSRTKKENTYTYNEVDKLKDTEIIINSTPVGMFPNNYESPLDISLFPNLDGVIDCIYNPLRPKIVVDAIKNGIVGIGGLYMLITQAYYAVKIFLNKEIDFSENIRIYNGILKEKENIVLTGMPTCGKSSLGKIIAQKYKKEFVDTDKLIEEKSGMTCRDYIQTYGEEKFRILESSIIEEISKKNNLVISTGGGAILKEKNIDCLKQNGRIIFIDRSLEKLIPTEDRPLSKDIDSLKKRYEERYDIYYKTADIILKNDGKIEDAVKELEAIL